MQTPYRHRPLSSGDLQRHLFAAAHGPIAQTRRVFTVTDRGTSSSVVACLGASATVAIGSYDWIEALQHRPQNARRRFLRFAQGGDLAYNGLRRIPAIASCDPSDVIVLLGENDVLAAISRTYERIARRWKRLPRTPSPEWFHETMQAIVYRLKRRTTASIALSSLIPIGEDPHSTDPFQSAANHYVEQYSAIICDIATQESVAYIPLYERLRAIIERQPGQSLTAFNLLPFYRDAVRQFVLHKTHDEIGRLNGWRFHRDGIHLNSVSGGVLVELVEEWLKTAARSSHTS